MLIVPLPVVSPAMGTLQSKQHLRQKHLTGRCITGCRHPQALRSRASFCAKLPLMRWRYSIGLGIAVGIVLWAIGVIPACSHVSLTNQSSAPAASIPSAFIQPTAVGQILQSHSGGGDSAYRTNGVRCANECFRAFTATVDVVAANETIYGPLHKRPPPSLS